LAGAGKLAELQGDSVRACALLEQALALYRGFGDRAGEADALLYLGRAARDSGDYTRAIALEQGSLSVFQGAGNVEGMLWSYLSLGDAALDQCDFTQAQIYFEQAQRLSEQLGDRGSKVAALSNLGCIAYHQGDLALAKTYYEDCLILSAELENRWGVILYLLGRLAQTEGDYVQALGFYKQSMSRLNDFGDLHFMALCLEGLAGVIGAHGQPIVAARLFGAAAAFRATVSAPMRPVDRTDYERDLTATKAELDDATWAAAWEAGAALTWEQAMVEAGVPRQ